MAMAAIAVLPAAIANKYLYHIDDVADKDIGAKVDAVLRVIAERGASFLLSVDRLHKHYLLVDGEVVTYVLRRDAETGEVVARMAPAAVDPSSTFPVAFAVKDGALVATAVMVRDECSAALEAVLEAVVADTALVQAVLEAIEATDSAQYVGVSLRLEAVMGCGAVREDTYENRVQTLVPMPLSETLSAGKSVVITSWVAEGGATGGVDGGKPWTRSCSRYCDWGPFKGHETIHQRS